MVRNGWDLEHAWMGVVISSSMARLALETALAAACEAAAEMLHAP